MLHRKTVTTLRLALLLGVSVPAFAAGSAALAQDATWLGATGDFGTATNWSGGSVPPGTATFTATGATSVTVGSETIGGFTFAAGASAYTFAVAGGLNFVGAGILNNSGQPQTLNISGGALDFLKFLNTSTAGNATITNHSALYFFDTSTAGNATITNIVGSGLSFADSSTAGNARITNNGNLFFSQTSTAGSATITNNTSNYFGLILQFDGTSTAGNATITNNAHLNFYQTSTAGSAKITNNVITNFYGTSSAGSAEIINNDTLQFNNNSTASNAKITNNGGSITFFNDTSTAGSAVITIAHGSILRFHNTSTAGSAAINNSGELSFYNTSTAGNARLITTAAGSTTFAGTGPLGDSRVSAGSIEGAGSYNLGSAQLTVGGNGRSTEVSGVISGPGASLTKVGSGSLTLSGINSYAGATTVNGGSLIVNGSIVASSDVTVAAGTTVGGSGTLPAVVINGGTLSPGNSPGTLTVKGNLTLTPGSTYIAEVQGAVADRVNVTGTAALAGTLRLAPLGGAYTFNSAYTLLSAAGGLGGTRFSPVDTTGSFGDGVTTAVNYTTTDVQLTLTPKPVSPHLGVDRSANANAYAIAAAIDAAVANGADPSVLFGIYNLPAAAIPAAVNSLSGEVHTAAPALAHVASDQFLRTMLDGSGAGRLTGLPGGPGGATSFSADLPSKQDGPGRASFDPARFSLWGASFGSTGRSDGDRSVGSANRNLSDGHVAVGADIRLGSSTVVGAAVAGGQARASLSGGLGKAEADVFQAGLYGRTQLGAVKLAGALGYARLDTDTTRAILALARTGVAASYATQAWSGRIEASMPVASWGGLTLSPLAAFQAVQARSPAAVERDGSGATAGMLTLARRSDMTSRSELGLQLDAKMLAGATPVTGFVRATWAHYYQRDADLTAALNGLPGASFAVTGARPDRNAALLAAGADIRLSQTVSLGMRVDSELSANTRRLGGTAQLRVSF